jgi:hypothetical protein
LTYHLKSGDDRGKVGIGGETFLDRSFGQDGMEVGGGPKVHIGIDDVRSLNDGQCQIPQNVDGIFGAAGIVLGPTDRLDGELLFGTPLADGIGFDFGGIPIGKDGDGNGMLSPSLTVLWDHPYSIVGELRDESEGHVGYIEGIVAGGGVGSVGSKDVGMSEGVCHIFSECCEGGW